MAVEAPASLHPADQEHADRLSRAIERINSQTSYTPRCDHGRIPGECGNCLGLRHAEQNSIAVRVAYGLGEWPPAVRS